MTDASNSRQGVPVLCGEFVRSELQTCRPDDSVVQCAHIMRDYDVGIVPVVDAAGRPVGVVTDRDLALRVLAQQLPPLTTLSRVMSPEVITCRVDETLEAAEERLARSQRSRIIVVNRDGAAMGVISLSDISQVAPVERSGSLLKRIARREALEHAASE